MKYFAVWICSFVTLVAVLVAALAAILDPSLAALLVAALTAILVNVLAANFATILVTLLVGILAFASERWCLQD